MLAGMLGPAARALSLPGHTAPPLAVAVRAQGIVVAPAPPPVLAHCRRQVRHTPVDVSIAACTGAVAGGVFLPLPEPR